MKFESFGKIPRLTRECIVTEKIDGSNGQVFIEHACGMNMRITPQEGRHYTQEETGTPGTFLTKNGCAYFVTAGSRKRWIDVLDDNFGFARWVHNNSSELLDVLGPGQHFGEWWGSGINRGYGLEKGEKRFSLFNRGRWNEENKPECCEVVPILYQGMFSTNVIDHIVNYRLPEEGSHASPGYMNPEGVIVYHVAGNSYWKKTIFDDEKPKGSTE